MITSPRINKGAFAILSAAMALVCLTGVDVQGESIDDAVAQVKRMVREGKSRAEIGRWVTRKLDNRIRNLNSPWEGYVAGIWEDPDQKMHKAHGEWRGEGIFSYDRAAKWAWEKRVGQCEEQACSAYYILHKAGVPGRLQIIGTKSHAFVVWGMREGADLNDSSTWGDEAVIVDGWLGDPQRNRRADAGIAEGIGQRIGEGITAAIVYRGNKVDHTPVYAGNLVIGGPWTLIVDYRNARLSKDRVKFESELLVNQTGDRFTGEITRGEMKVQLTDGWIKQGGLLSLQFVAGPLKGTGLFRFSEDGKSFKGRYTTTIVYEGQSFPVNVQFTGTVDGRTLTLIPAASRAAGR